MHAVAHKLPPPPHLPKPLPPAHRPSAFSQAASRWTPAGVALILSAIVPIVSIWQVNAETQAALKEALDTNEKQDKALKKITAELHCLAKRHRRFLNNEIDYRQFTDAAFCELGAKPSHGCPPGVEYYPRPLNKKAPPIQPRVRTYPLLPDNDDDC